LLRQLGAALSDLVGHARPVVAAQRAQLEAPPSPPAAAGSLDVKALRALSELLAQQDLSAIDSIRELGPSIRAAWGDEPARELSDAVERLEFARAAALLAARSGDAQLTA
jgi:hypothetical protein